MNERVDYWIDLAKYDLHTARVMLNGKRFLYVGFMCHQAIEKILKAYYVHVTDEHPPYTHNLGYLAEQSGIVTRMTQQQQDFLDRLGPLNIESRYPSYKQQLLRELDERTCREILQQTRGLYRWIRQQLLSA